MMLSDGLGHGGPEHLGWSTSSVCLYIVRNPSRLCYVHATLELGHLQSCAPPPPRFDMLHAQRPLHPPPPPTAERLNMEQSMYSTTKLRW